MAMTPTQWLCDLEDIAVRAEQIANVTRLIREQVKREPHKRVYLQRVDRSLLYGILDKQHDLDSVLSTLFSIKDQMDGEYVGRP